MRDGPDGGLKKCRLLAHASENEPLSTSLFGDGEETNVFHSRFNKPDGTSLHQITNETHIVTPVVLGRLVQRNGRPVPTGFPCQQPQRHDEAHAACTHPNKNEPSYSAVTQGNELLRHPVVEQLAMVGIRSQRITSDDTTREQSPKSCFARASDARSVDNIGVHHFFTRLRTNNTARLQEVLSKNGLVHFPDDGLFTRRQPATDGRAVIKYFKHLQKPRDRPPRR